MPNLGPGRCWMGTKVRFIVPEFAKFTSPVLSNGTSDLTLPVLDGDDAADGEIICASFGVCS